MRLYSLLLLTLFTGCTRTMNYDPVMLRFDSPETSGKPLSGSFNISIGATGTRVIGGEESEVPIDTRFTYGTTGLNINTGVLSRLDLYARSFLNSPYIIGGKYQIFGQALDKSTQGWKVSISGELGSLSKSENVLFETTTDSGSLSMKYYGASLNIGYRFNSNWIVYLHNFYSHNNISSTIERRNMELQSFGGLSEGFGNLLGFKYYFNSKNGTNIFNFRPFLGLEIGTGRYSWPDKMTEFGIVHRSNNKFKPESSIGVTFGTTW